MEGDTFEMEDHRNWTDASFKTYVRPLALPWPYTLQGGRDGSSSRSALTLERHAAEAGEGAAARSRSTVTLGARAPARMPAIGLGVPAEEVEHAHRRRSTCSRRAAPQHAHLPVRSAPEAMAAASSPRYRAAVRADRRRRRAGDHRRRASASPDAELAPIAAARAASRAEARGRRRVARPAISSRCCPAAPRPPAPPLRGDLRGGARGVPGRPARRRHVLLSSPSSTASAPPARAARLRARTRTCPIVHAADDRLGDGDARGAALRQVQSTARPSSARHALPHRAERASAAATIPTASDRHAESRTTSRVCLAEMDPRQRGLFGAAWTLGYIAASRRGGVEAISHRRADRAARHHLPQDRLRRSPISTSCKGRRSIRSITSSPASAAASATSSIAATSCDAAAVAASRIATRRGTVLWLANLTGEEQTVKIDGFARRRRRCTCSTRTASRRRPPIPAGSTKPARSCASVGSVEAAGPMRSPGCRRQRK